MNFTDDEEAPASVGATQFELADRIVSMKAHIKSLEDTMKVLETELIDRFPPLPPGSHGMEVGGVVSDGSKAYQINISIKETKTWDQDELSRLVDVSPTIKAIKTKLTVDPKVYETLDPDDRAALAKALEIKPGKVKLTIKETDLV